MQSPHPCIVWKSCSFPCCARCLCFLPVSDVLLDASAGISSLPLCTIRVPSALSLCFVPSSYMNIFPLVPFFTFGSSLPCLLLSLISSLPSPSVTLPSTFHSCLLSSSLSHLSVSVSGLRTAPAPQGRPNCRASKSWMTSARK